MKSAGPFEYREKLADFDPPLDSAGQALCITWTTLFWPKHFSEWPSRHAHNLLPEILNIALESGTEHDFACT